ncbi:hypothetical protein FHG66_10685 [Rubellimicrobium rubrum]|uniref:DUF1311 domain-containing protein n=1 Tax=Rubellimicrobium rubrum TaxID=2585369 RepID=A0A5C4MU37_9RHOB|nr:hypothetical protein [Rubellimicrobium rubrum]TNC49576.1 hypothetical protein FHG66_10685 [Rubellimicrobium rubrum]
MTTTTTRISLALTVALAGFGAAGLAQDASDEPVPPGAGEELVVPQIDAPAAPPMTEDEAAAQEPTPDAGGTSGLSDFTPPDMSAPRAASEYRTCPDREPRPSWIEELKGWDSIRGLVISEIYQTRSYEQIVATGDCSCAVKAPPWDAAEAEYQEKYAAMTNRALREVRHEFQLLSSGLHDDARRICQAQGNW